MRLEHRGTYTEYWPTLSEWVKRAAGNACIRCHHPAGDRQWPDPLDAARRRMEYDRGKRYLVGPPVKMITRLAPCTPACTHPHEDVKMRALTVHHLNGDKSCEYWWNLLALCQVCHLVVQAKLIPERPYLWEHTEWFKPYAAGYYAAQAGIFLSRATIVDSLNHWLQLGQPWLYETA